jgi:hypothetical protein
MEGKELMFVLSVGGLWSHAVPSSRQLINSDQQFNSW